MSPSSFRFVHNLPVVLMADAPIRPSPCFSPARHPMIREPAVAGSFYPRNAAQLERDVRKLLAPQDAPGAAQPPRTRALGCIVPHAGNVKSA